MYSRVRKVEVLKLPNGKSPYWYLRWWELTPDGSKWKERCRSTKTTVKREAERYRREIERELDAGRRAEAEMTWEDFVKDFLDKHALRKPKSTLSLYRHCLNKFGQVGKPRQLAKVTHTMLEDFTNNRLKQEAAVASVNRDLRHIRAALRWAKRRGYISEAPDFKGVFVREDRKKPVIIPEEDFMEIVKALRNPKLVLKHRSAEWWRVFLYVAYNWRGNSCWKLREYDLAQADFDAAVAIDPQDYHAYWGLGQLRGAQGDAAAALAMWDKAVALAPTTSPVLLLERGQFHAQLGNRDKALADYSRVIEWLRPRLGLAKSIRTYRGAMNGDPQAWYIRACQERSKIYKQLGQLDKAQDDLKEALRPAPKSAESYRARGIVEAEQGEFDKAIADFSEVIRLNPLSPLDYRNRGITYLKKGNFDRAIADFTEAIRLEPKCAGDYAFRGAAYSHKHELEHAIADFEKAIELQPDNPGNCNDLAWCLVTCPERRIWKPARAVELAKKATERAPGNGAYWNTLGVAQYRAGDYEAAIKTLGKSMELGSGGVAFDWFFLAMAHWQLKHTEEARRWYDKGVAWMEKNKSDDDELLRFRAEAAELLGIGKK